MPESSSRKKAAYIPPPAKSSGPKVNPPWFLPVMLTLMLLGLAWIVVTYLTQSAVPDPGHQPVEPADRLRLHHRRLRHDDPLALTPPACSDRRRPVGTAPSSSPGVHKSVDNYSRVTCPSDTAKGQKKTPNEAYFAIDAPKSTRASSAGAANATTPRRSFGA